MSIQKQVLLRYRAEGHLRFDLPTVLCTPESASELVSGLLGLEGVYRADARGGKLSIRYISGVCAFADVVRRLNTMIDRLASRTRPEPSPPSPAAGAAPAATAWLKNRLQEAGKTLQSIRMPGVRPLALPATPVPGVTAPASWLKGKLQEARETFQALRILMRKGGIAERPRWLREFMNDLVMLYLIKIHWQHIVHEWLPRPWTYRYEWAATVYLIYLSVQSKAPRLA